MPHRTLSLSFIAPQCHGPDGVERRRCKLCEFAIQHHLFRRRTEKKRKHATREVAPICPIAPQCHGPEEMQAQALQSVRVRDSIPSFPQKRNKHAHPLAPPPSLPTVTSMTLRKHSWNPTVAPLLSAWLMRQFPKSCAASRSIMCTFVLFGFIWKPS